MEYYPLPIASLIEELSKLPGVGRKTAQRLAFYILEMEPMEAEKLANSIVSAKEKIRYCSIKPILDIPEDPCYICRNSKRDPSTICVVQGPRDVVAMEKTREYNGLYHVLQGAISPMDNIGPNDITIKECK